MNSRKSKGVEKWMIFSDIEKAGDLAEQVALQIKNSNGNLRTVYYKLEEILINYRKNNVDVDLIMPAIYEVDFDASLLPSGVYFYKLSAGEFSESRKMILVK